MALFKKIIEWVDETKDTMVYKYPLKDGGRDVNNNSKITVRDSQIAVFVHKGQVADIFLPGQYDLKTEILPILSKLAGWQFKFQTPISLDIYFVSTRLFNDIKWGTKNPIIIRDPEFGSVRVKGFGAFSFKVDDAGKFVTQVNSTNLSYKVQEIQEYLKTMTVSALADCLGESKLSVLDMASQTLEFNEIVKNAIQEKFRIIGLRLMEFFVENISVPTEVEKALDERTKLGILGDKTDVMTRIAAAEAIKEAAKNPGMGGLGASMGVGLGAGAGLGQVFADALKPTQKEEKKACPKCGAHVALTAKFCPECGKKFNQGAFCPNCGAEISGKNKFCPECGEKI